MSRLISFLLADSICEPHEESDKIFAHSGIKTTISHSLHWRSNGLSYRGSDSWHFTVPFCSRISLYIVRQTRCNISQISGFKIATLIDTSFVYWFTKKVQSVLPHWPTSKIPGISSASSQIGRIVSSWNPPPFLVFRFCLYLCYPCCGKRTKSVTFFLYLYYHRVHKVEHLIEFVWKVLCYFFSESSAQHRTAEVQLGYWQLTCRSVAILGCDESWYLYKSPVFKQIYAHVP